MILITGASGLLGLHLLHQLSLGDKKIRAIFNTQKLKLLPATDETMVEWMQADVLDLPALEKAFEGVTTVYHCAAMVSYDKRLRQTMMDINVEGTANVVNVCLAKNIKKLVHVSSIASIGKTGNDTLIHEQIEFNVNEVNSNYAKSKFESEMEVWRGIAEGLSAVIVNPAIILGEGDWQKSSSNLFKIVHDEFPYFTNGITAWVDAKDVAKAMILLMHSEIESERFILSCGNYSFKEVFTLMANAMNKKPPTRYASSWMTNIVWRLAYTKSILTGKVATITSESVSGAHQKSYFSNAKFLNAFPNYKFELIQHTIERVGQYYVPKI
jgi:dihydroflavonol-4-reductase